MGAFSSGQLANAICDRCGFRYPYNELTNQVVAGVETKLRVCWLCLDIDHEQLQIGRIVKSDPQALQDARNEPNLDEMRSFFGWNPVCGSLLDMRSGQVVVP